MIRINKFFRHVLFFLAALTTLGGVVVGALYFYLAPQLPAVDVLRDVRFQVPLQVYSSDGLLIAEYGDKKRHPVRFPEVPDLMVKAIIASEDDRFFDHPGVDYQGILRAVYQLIRTGERAQGGSTITMQVARNFFLSREKTYLRKLNEIFLALKIERELSKEQILTLYFNKIYLGNRAYGIASAAQVYYGTSLHELSLAQLAMVAGLPKAPSRYNPIINPERALIRRNYVLGRMQKLGFITTRSYHQAKAELVSARLHKVAIDLEAPYVGEMVRSYMVKRHGEEAYTAGYKVYTTITSKLQHAAKNSLRKTLLEYTRRHGFRGPLQNVELTPEMDPEKWDLLLSKHPRGGGLKVALITALEEQSATAYLGSGIEVPLAWEGLQWARPYINTNQRGRTPKRTTDLLQVGDIVYLQAIADEQWHLAQLPDVAGALVSLKPEDGAIQALVGGFDFFLSKFNRAKQAKRQPGSSFKPFVYSAALEKGFTTASIINDAPVVFDDSGLETSWRPENYSGRIYGPTRLRKALTYSRNLVSIRLLQAIGIPYAINYVQRFGFDPARLPRDLSLSLGSAAVTPLELAEAYAVFANGGYRVYPYLIQRIDDVKGETLFEAQPESVCRECEFEQVPQHEEPLNDLEATNSEEIVEMPEPKFAEQVVTSQNVYLITSMMRDVIREGTGRKALQLGRKDLAGKTGTTNDQRDAWFAGFNGDLVTVSWVGFDNAQPLGDRETGGRAALPMWIDFMRVALQGQEETVLEQPPGVVTVRIDPESGLLAGADQKDAIFETFREESVPRRHTPDVDESVIPEADQSGGAGGGSPILF